jgi:hypothetical protein
MSRPKPASGRWAAPANLSIGAMIGIGSAGDLCRSNAQTAAVRVMYLKPNPGVVTVRPVVGAPSNHQLVARALRRAAPGSTSTVPANDREPDLRTALGE